MALQPWYASSSLMLDQIVPVILLGLEYKASHKSNFKPIHPRNITGIGIPTPQPSPQQNLTQNLIFKYQKNIKTPGKQNPQKIINNYEIFKKSINANGNLSSSLLP